MRDVGVPDFQGFLSFEPYDTLKENERRKRKQKKRCPFALLSE